MLLEEVGGEAGCRRLSQEFYKRVGTDRALRRLFPGKSLRCATGEFAAFLIQFLGGDEAQTQKRWWLSLRESHARFRIRTEERAAWLRHMNATLDAADIGTPARKALKEFFLHGASYVSGQPADMPRQQELAQRWGQQQLLDEAVAAIASGVDEQALALAPRFSTRPSVFVGLLARMMQSGRTRLVEFAAEAIRATPSLASHRFATWTLLHWAASAGCIEIASLLLHQGADPNVEDGGGHTPLYRATSPEIVRVLVRAGAKVDAGGGVTRATPLHMAARRGDTPVAAALLECGADPAARDRKGDTPLQRAINCRKQETAALLRKVTPSR